MAYTQEKKTIKTVPEKDQRLDFLDECLKSAILNVSELKETMSKITKGKYENDVSPNRRHQ